MLVLKKGKSIPNHDLLIRAVQESLDEGIEVNRGVKEMAKTLENRLGMMRDNAETVYGIKNLNSDKQIKDCFLGMLEQHELELCRVGDKLSFGADSLKKLSNIGHSLADDIMSYRKLTKKLDSMKGIIRYMKGDGRFSPNISVGKTNRINYSEPALMNIPKDILWDLIKSRRENGVLYTADISSQEPWILIYTLNIKVMIDLMEYESDFYNAVYKAVFKVDCPNEKVRDDVKIVWNIMSYGGSMFAINKVVKVVDGGAIYRYFQDIPEYKSYYFKCRALAKKNVQKSTTYFGTELYANELGSKLARVLMDIPIQGTGSDILALLVEHMRTKIAMAGLRKMMDIYFTRHDEIVFDVDGSLDEEFVLKFIEDNMTHRIDDWKPFIVKANRVG